MKKTILSLAISILLLLPITMLAFEVNGIEYCIDSYYDNGTNVEYAVVASRVGGYSGTITIPSSVAYGGNSYSVTQIGDYAFDGCSGLTSITIPNSVTTIGDFAFAGCYGLTSASIGNSVTTIGIYAFDGCSGLTSVSIPNSVTTIGNYAFFGCSGLTSITIPNSVETIGEYAFHSCSNLANVTIGNSVNTIGNSAFAWCSSLTSVTIPASVTSIGNEAFSDCSSLTSINVEEGSTCFSSESGVLFDKTKETIVSYPGGKKGAYTIPSTVTTIRDNAFSSCTYLSKVVIPNSVTSIGKSAFLNCSSLSSITIPSSVTTIGYEAFSSCNGLTSVTFPNSVTSIGERAFYVCSSLTSVIIGNSVTTIEPETFYRCFNLTDVTIGNSVTTIEKEAFFDCDNLTNVTIGNAVTEIGYRAFCGCSGLENVTIPNSVTTIGYEAFSSCNGLTNVTIGNSVTTIDRYAFHGCSSLLSIIIPNSVTTIDDSFMYCSRLESVTIGNSMKKIIAGMFSECSSLREIYLGTSVEEIGSGAFTSRVITDVYFQSTTPVWIFPASFANPEAITFHVPAGCKQAYLDSQDLWKSYTIVEDGSEATNYAYVDAVGNSFALLLNYDDEEKNTVVIQDGYKSITVDEDILLKQISYERNFTNTSWQSLYVPFEIPVTAELLEDFELAYINAARQYDYDDDGTIDELTIEIFKVKSGTLRANHPYLIRAKETGMKAITVNEATLYATAANQVDCSTTSLSFTFKGAYETLTYDDIYDCRLLGSGKWNTPTSTTTMKPMRFYLKIASRGNEQVLPASSSATPIRMTVWGEDGEATEIDDLQMADSESPHRRVFDLQGCPVEKLESGIYIINGKKVIIK